MKNIIVKNNALTDDLTARIWAKKSIIDGKRAIIKNAKQVNSQISVYFNSSFFIL